MAESWVCQDLSCQLCTGLLTEPVTLSVCLHSFCKACLEKWVYRRRGSKRHPYKCPKCWRPFSPSDVKRVNRQLRRIVLDHSLDQIFSKFRVELEKDREKRLRGQIDRLEKEVDTMERKDIERQFREQTDQLKREVDTREREVQDRLLREENVQLRRKVYTMEREVSTARSAVTVHADSLVIARDRAVVHTGSWTFCPSSNVDSEDISDRRSLCVLETQRQPRLMLDLPRQAPTAPIIQEQPYTCNTVEVACGRNAVDQNSRPECQHTYPPQTVQLLVSDDCGEFAAETPRQFWDRSVTLLGRHFLLVMFMIHAFIFVVCLFKAMI